MCRGSRAEGKREARDGDITQRASEQRQSGLSRQTTSEGGGGGKHYANRCTVPHVVGYSAQVDRREEGCTYYVNCRLRIAGP